MLGISTDDPYKTVDKSRIKKIYVIMICLEILDQILDMILIEDLPLISLQIYNCKLLQRFKANQNKCKKLIVPR